MSKASVKLELTNEQALNLQRALDRAIEELELDIRDDLDLEACERVIRTIHHLANSIDRQLREPNESPSTEAQEIYIAWKSSSKYEDPE